MSFASEMKNELTRIDVDEMNAKAELSALIRMNGALSLSNQQFVIKCSNGKCNNGKTYLFVD